MEGDCKDSICTVGIAQASVTGYKDVSINSDKTLMSTVAQQAASISAAGTKKRSCDLKTFVERHGAQTKGRGVRIDFSGLWNSSQNDA